MDLSDTLTRDTPPDSLSGPLQALWWLARGQFRIGPEWDRAHHICQGAEGTTGYDLAHAVAHLAEGDIGNADYWFRRAGFARQSDDPAAEWARAVARLQG